MFSADIAGSTSASGPYLPYEILEDYRGPDQIMSKLDTFDYEIVHRSPGTTLETAKVVIILEKHNDLFYARFYGLVLNCFYNSRGDGSSQIYANSQSDILFLEAPIYTDLWWHILKEVEIYSKLNVKNNILGWGNSNFYKTVRTPFQRLRKPVIDSALKAVYNSGYSQSSEEENTEAERIIKEACPSLRGINDLDQLHQEARKLLTEEIALASDTAFITNQKKLIERINRHYNENKTLFFTCGKLHGHLRSVKKAKYQSSPELIASVEELYRSLEGKSFMIIYPKKPKVSFQELLRQCGIEPTRPTTSTVQATMNYISSFFSSGV
jgi:hypothetical protein